MSNTAPASLWRRLRYTRLQDLVRFRADGRLDWQQTVATAGLPAELADMVAVVVRRTRLWRGERVEVAQELVAHFRDGLEAGRSPEQLAQSFGDARMAARLIRRAKKRGRPLVWHLWRWSVWAFLAIVAIYFVSGLYLLLGRPSISTDYLARINARAFAVPEDERAWPLYREALLELGLNEGIRDFGWDTSPLGLSMGTNPDDAHWPQVEQFLLDHQPALAKLHQAGQKESLGMPVWNIPASYAPEDRPVLTGISPDEALTARREFPDLKDRTLISTLLPHVQLLREVSGILQSDCRRAARAGDADAALADVIAQLGISRHVQETPFLVSALLAAAIQEIALSTIQEVLREYPDLWSKEQLRDLAHAVARAEVDWQRALDGDRASFYDIIQRAYTDDGSGDGRLTLDGLRLLHAGVVQGWAGLIQDGSVTPLESWLATESAAAAQLPAANMVIASRAEMVALYDRFMRDAARDLKSPVWEWDEDGADQLLESLSHNKLTALRYVFVGLLAPAATSVRGVAEFRRGMRDGALIGIALEVYRREHDGWPQSLDQLSPRWLPAVPVDRITGGPLRYKIVDGRPLVYSVGVDLDDDAGRIAPGRTDAPPVPEPRFAGPAYWRPGGTDRPEHDGDWVLWTSNIDKKLEADER
jgi:hypothetical protein